MKKFSCGLCHALCTQRVQWRSLYKQERLQVPQNSCHGVVGRRGIIITWPMRHYRPCWAPGEHEACSCMRKQWKKLRWVSPCLQIFSFAMIVHTTGHAYLLLWKTHCPWESIQIYDISQRRMVMSVRTVVDMKFFGNWPFYVHGTENYVLI